MSSVWWPWICAHTSYPAVYYFPFKIPSQSAVLGFQIPVQALVQFVEALEIGYSKYKNPYHNLIHAADVTQTAHFLMLHTGLMVTLTPFWQRCHQHRSRTDIKTVTALCVPASLPSTGSVSSRFLRWSLLQPFTTLNTQGPPTTSTSTPGTADQSNQCDPAAVTDVWNQSCLLVLYWCLLATWCPITVCRSNTLNYCVKNLANVFLHLLCVAALSWWCACVSGQRWPFCTMTGPFWRTTTWALPTGWWWRRTWTYLSTWTRMTGGEKKYTTQGLKLPVITEQMILTVLMDFFSFLFFFW